MALRPEASEPAVDDLKRRARRRLVGAIVLALAAAIILPLLLESDPKPLGDEVSVRIPPVDNSKFVNPLSPDRGPDAAAPEVKTSRKSINDAERRALGQPVPSTPKADVPAPSAVPKPDGAAKSDATVKPQAAAPLPATNPSPSKIDGETPKIEPAKAEPAKTESAKTEPPKAEPMKTEPPKAEPPKSEPSKSEPPKADVAKSDTTRTTAPTPAPVKGGVGSAKPDAAPGPGAFVVQVGAFVDTKAATDLVAQVKSSGFAAYTEGVPTTRGTVHRVRVGPFATRAEADAGLAKLKAAGYDRALVTPTK